MNFILQVLHHLVSPLRQRGESRPRERRLSDTVNMRKPWEQGEPPEGLDGGDGEERMDFPDISEGELPRLHK